MQADEVQLRAIQHGDGPMLVTAGPGSGKTYVITHRIHYLIHSLGISPEKILVITFTKYSAMQMKERFAKLCDDAQSAVCFGTFHALFYRIIQESRVTGLGVASHKDKVRILYDIVKEDGAGYPEKELLEEFLRQFSLIKNMGFTRDAYEPAYFEKKFFWRIYEKYHHGLKTAGKIDFDDMLLECLNILKTKPEILKHWQNMFSYILVDEFQDINAVQYEILLLLAGNDGNLFCVGDEDQAIYAFRGASPDLMFRFLKDCPTAQQIMMTANYRSDANIVSISADFISKNKNRFRKEIAGNSKALGNIRVRCKNTTGIQYESLVEDLRDVMTRKPDYSMAILLRTNRISQHLLGELSRNGISCRIKTGLKTLLQEDVTKDILAYLELASGKLNHENILRIMNKPLRYLSKELLKDKNLTWEGIELLAMKKRFVYERFCQFRQQIEFMKDLPLYGKFMFIKNSCGYGMYLKERDIKNGNHEGMEVLEEIRRSIKEYESFDAWRESLEENEAQNTANETESEDTGVSILTMHGAKGLEWDAVFIPDICDGMLPFHKAKNQAGLEEERRIMYVALTRAKRELFLYSVHNPIEEKKESIYFKELDRFSKALES